MTELHAGQRQVFDDGTQHRVVSTGRRWGKNVLLEAEMDRAAQQGLSCAVLGLIGTDDRLRRKAYELGQHMWYWFAKERATQPKYERNRLWTLGGKEKDGIPIGSYDLILVNEAALFPCFPIMGVFREASKPETRWLFIGTPLGPHADEFQALFKRGQASLDTYMPNYRSWVFASELNPYFGDPGWQGTLPAETSGEF